jgi:hypothetical protein
MTDNDNKSSAPSYDQIKLGDLSNKILGVSSSTPGFAIIFIINNLDMACAALRSLKGLKFKNRFARGLVVLVLFLVDDVRSTLKKLIGDTDFSNAERSLLYDIRGNMFFYDADKGVLIPKGNLFCKS